MKGFKYQITMKTLLRKQKEHVEKEFNTVNMARLAEKRIYYCLF